MLDLDDVKNNNRERRQSMNDLANVYKLPAKKWVSLRFLTGVVAEAGYWVKTKTRAGKQTKFFTPCPSFDPETQERDSTIPDPWRDLQEKEQRLIQAGDLDKDHAKVQYAVTYWMQAIVRAEQKKKPSKLAKPTSGERESKFKDKDSDTWTPVYVVKVGRALAGKLKELKGLNTVESAKTGSVKAFAVNDPKFGRDVRIYFDEDKAPAQMYECQLGEKRTPLTEEELAYLTYDTSVINAVEFDPKEVKRDFESWASRNNVKTGAAPSSKNNKSREDDDEDDDFDDDEDEAPKSKKSSKSKPPAKKGKAKDEDFDDDDDSDDEDSDDDFDDDEDESPKSKKKAPTKKSKASSKSKDDDFDDDEDEEEDDLDEDEDGDDFDDDDEDEAPKSKKKPAAKSSKKKSSKDDDFDDEDDDDEDDDDLDEDNEESDDEDEEEDEAPKSKKKKAPPAKKTSSKKKSSKDDDFDDEDEDDLDDDDDSDDDEGDFDDEDEDEDEKPAKKRKAPAKKAPPAKKSSKRSSKNDEDDDEDF